VYEPAFEHVFPAIRGVQAGQEYYVTMCPLKYIPKIFEFHEDELSAELRAQRHLNDRRIPGIKQYLLENKDTYVFSSITASVSGKVGFVPMDSEGAGSKIGALKIDMDSVLNIIDGQHRRAAIEAALAEEPALGNETISVVFFVEKGLEQRQQMFSDLNLYQVKVNPSTSKTYDQRDRVNVISRALALQCPAFKGLIDFDQTSLSKRSRKLFTHNALNQATSALIKGLPEASDDKTIQLHSEFWLAVSDNLLQWQQIQKGKLTSGESRQDFIHSHAVFLHAMGLVGASLLRTRGWKAKLKKLAAIDWQRSASDNWQGRCVTPTGALQKNNRSVQLTVNFIKCELGLKLSEDEQKVEASLNVSTL